MVVEDGAGLATANSYVSENDFGTYCDDRGITPATGDAEAALVRATQWIDNTYRNRFPGHRVNGRVQALEWPRGYAYDAFGYAVEDNGVPAEIVQATCEAALRELTETGSLAPDLDRGGQIRELQAGSVRVVYGTNATAQTFFQIIDGILARLLGAKSQYTSKAVRG